ncbi:hypothetical protein CBM2592_A160116 [Cupriavidus taiwanensis]|nr:hypothetical protein CBM2588_A120196 [Cupriavidus taiwanensis]SOY45733.1 hypothetical protein CBM2592_A160116 [Cupriavidus taiwanensis]SOZ53970.1 hypothetical protein CBM2617_A170027 [Cupriavidus taiwanensis]SOZ77738.1 hypothetical protein CBM2622_A150194 [Cupriavidus taiwanensis]SOZ78143.1 hypothetical protein CBM2618_A160196 [Cupriavidus taiwanensis]
MAADHRRLYRDGCRHRDGAGGDLRDPAVAGDRTQLAEDGCALGRNRRVHHLRHRQPDAFGLHHAGRYLDADGADADPGCGDGDVLHPADLDHPVGAAGREDSGGVGLVELRAHYLRRHRRLDLDHGVGEPLCPAPCAAGRAGESVQPCLPRSAQPPDADGHEPGAGGGGDRAQHHSAGRHAWRQRYLLDLGDAVLRADRLCLADAAGQGRRRIGGCDGGALRHTPAGGQRDACERPFFVFSLDPLYSGPGRPMISEPIYGTMVPKNGTKPKIKETERRCEHSGRRGMRAGHVRTGAARGHVQRRH